jgi:hypothetical protein
MVIASVSRAKSVLRASSCLPRPRLGRSRPRLDRRTTMTWQIPGCVVLRASGRRGSQAVLPEPVPPAQNGWGTEENWSERFLCVSSLKERGRSTGLVERYLVVGGWPTGNGAAQRGRTTLGPSRADAGSTAREPEWATTSFAVVQGQRAAPSPATAGRGQPEARVPVIPSPRRGGMELCGRSRAGSIKRATTPPGGGHDTHERAPGCAEPFTSPAWAPGSGFAPGRRAGRSRPG